MILELAIKVAEKIIETKIEEQSKTFLPIVKRQLKKQKIIAEIQLHVHPVHYEDLLEQKEELRRPIFTKDTDLFIYPDE